MSVESDSSAAPRCSTGFARRRVLCVDDDPAITRLVARCLGRRGYLVETETNPLAATALDDALSAEELAESGVSHLVAKPFDFGSIADALEDALGRRGPARWA
jgi:hypothetical protein